MLSALFVFLFGQPHEYKTVKTETKNLVRYVGEAYSVDSIDFQVCEDCGKKRTIVHYK